jgi:hypothetical protein
MWWWSSAGSFVLLNGEEFAASVRLPQLHLVENQSFQNSIFFCQFGVIALANFIKYGIL